MIAKASDNVKVVELPMSAADVYPALPRSATLLVMSPTKVGIDLNGDDRPEIVHCRETGKTLVIGAADRWEHVPRSMRKPDGDYFYRVTSDRDVEVNYVPGDKFASCSRPRITPEQEERGEQEMAAASEGLFGEIMHPAKGDSSRINFNQAGLIA